MARISWASVGITPWHKREIMAYCRRYDDWRKELQYGLRAISVEGGSHSNNISRPTEQQAVECTAPRSDPADRTCDP